MTLTTISDWQNQPDFSRKRTELHDMETSPAPQPTHMSQPPYQSDQNLHIIQCNLNCVQRNAIFNNANSHSTSTQTPSGTNQSATSTIQFHSQTSNLVNRSTMGGQNLLWIGGVCWVGFRSPRLLSLRVRCSTV